MRKPLLLVVVVGLALTAAAAFAAPTAVPTKTPGVLTVGFDVPAPGFWNGRVTGTTIKNPTGFEAQLAQAIAKNLGDHARSSSCARRSAGSSRRRRSRTTSRWKRRRSRLQRAKVVSFSAPYFDANQGVLIRKGLAKPTSIAALKSLQLCAQADTTGLSYIQHTLRPAKRALVYNASSTAAFDAVEAGKCDALILDVPIVVAQSQKKPGAYGGVVGQIVTHEGYGAIMEKGSALKPSIDKAIKALKANGTIGKLQRKWLPFTRVPVLK